MAALKARRPGVLAVHSVNRFVFSVPKLDANAKPTDTPGFTDPSAMATAPTNVPPPPGSGDSGPGGGLTETAGGTAPFMPNLRGPSGHNGNMTPGGFIGGGNAPVVLSCFEQFFRWGPDGHLVPALASKMALTGHSGSHAPHSMHSSGWIYSLRSSSSDSM